MVSMLPKSLRIRHSLAALTAVCICAPLLPAQPQPATTINDSEHRIDKSFAQADNSSQKFHDLSEAYFADMFRLMPSWATSSGIHDYDSKLESRSPAFHAAKIATLKSYLGKFEGIKPQSLTPFEQHDAEILIASINSALLSLEQLLWWKRNPDEYSSDVSESIFNLVKRNFAPLPTRMRSVIDREKQIPAVLSNARINLQPDLIPPIYVEVALEQLPGIILFFQDSVPEAFTNVHDDKLQEELKTSTKDVIEALKGYQNFLKKDLLDAGVCKGQIAIGEENYRKKLLYDEMVDESIDSLLARGDAELKRLQKQFAATAHELAPDKTTRECFDDIAKKHPKPDELIKDVSDLMERIRNFCIDKEIITIPSNDRPIIEETPPFMRALTFASLESPGPLETQATETFYNITLPEHDWTPQQVEEHMRSFSYCDLINTSTHEAYPGHFVQFLWLRSAPSKVRKLIGCSSNDEGWAHYCEQMMVDEGFGKGDKELRMIQLHDALLRACRYMVGLRMHCRGMTLPEAVDFFMKEGFMERTNAEREAKRGTSDPTYLVYTLGKLEILKMRDDYRKLKGTDFKLKEFHNQFMKSGYPPLKIVREEMFSSAKQ